MTGKFDWVKDDPCYGCKYAKRLPDKDLQLFSRRFGCTSEKRRNDILFQAHRKLEMGNWDAESALEAYLLLGKVVDMDHQMIDNGHYACHDGIAPWCKEVEENNG